MEYEVGRSHKWNNSYLQKATAFQPKNVHSKLRGNLKKVVL